MEILLYSTVRSSGDFPGVSHKLHLDPPAGVSGKIDVLRHHITTRNFFAFLQRKCLVGFTFYQALVDLHERLEEYLPPGTDCIAAMRSFLIGIGLVNVSNEPRAAAGLLAWSEDVRWNEGWREAFVHSVGMYEQLNGLQESADISLPTKAHLDRKYLELQVRIQEVQDCLGKWYFDDAHYALVDEPRSARQASERFRKFLKQHYQKEYENWPLKKGSEAGNLWLDRKVTLRLQEDFGALYEHLVDRNVTWTDEGESEERQGHDQRKVLLKSSSENFGLDGDDDRMLRVFRNLDCRLNAPDNIPYPYPLLPASLPPPTDRKKGLFHKDKTKDRMRESRLAHVYNASSNSSLLGREYAFNTLMKAFVTFEKTDQPDVVDPREARRERWIIIYSVLSILANISVDVPNLSFKSNVDYFLNTHLDGLPPWCPEEKVFLEPSRQQSQCYTSPLTWQDDTYEHRTGPRGSIGHRSESSENSYNTRPLTPDSDSFSFKPAASVTSSFGFSTKHIGTKPSQFSYFDAKPSDFIASNPSQSQASERGGDATLSPVTSALPFNNIFEPSSRIPHSISEFGSNDSTSDYSSATPLTEASSSSRDSYADRSSSHHGPNSRRALPRKFAQLSGIDEYEAQPLPLRSGHGHVGREKGS